MEAHSRILARRIPMGGGAQRATVHGVTKSRTGLSNVACTHRVRTNAWSLLGGRGASGSPGIRNPPTAAPGDLLPEFLLQTVFHDRLTWGPWAGAMVLQGFADENPRGL